MRIVLIIGSRGSYKWRHSGSWGSYWRRELKCRSKELKKNNKPKKRKQKNIKIDWDLLSLKFKIISVATDFLFLYLLNCYNIKILKIMLRYFFLRDRLSLNNLDKVFKTLILSIPSILTKFLERLTW